MDINRFAKRVTLLEKGDKQISIAQVKEILRIVNDLTGGVLYKLIRWIRES